MTGHRWLAGVAAALLLVGLLPPTPARAALPAPVLVSPLGTTEGGAVVDFNWERVSGAVAYRLRVHHESPAGTQTIQATTVNDRYLATVSYAGDLAWWSVSAVDADGIEGEPASATFTTAALAPELLWPADGATLDFPVVDPVPEWRPVPDQPDGMFADQDIGSANPPGDPPSDFSVGTWRWHVRSTRAPSDELPPSPPSETRTFTLAWPGGVPAPTAPADGATFGPGEAVRLAWDPVPGAALYAWELGRPGQPLSDGNVNGVRATWANVTAWLAPGTYQWRVRAIRAGTVLSTTHGEPGPWSAYRTLTVTGVGVPTITSPADGAALTSWPVLRWTDVEGARAYTLQVSDSPDPDAPFHAPGPTRSAFTFRAPGAPSDMYAATTTSATRYWRVRADLAMYDAEPGEWTAWRSFTVTPAAVPLAAEVPATMLGPDDCTSDGCPDIDGVPLLRWEPVAGAASYRVFLRWDGGSGAPNSWIDTGSAGLPLSQYNVLTPGDRAAWAVVACPAGGCSETMPDTRRHFRVSLAVPQQLGLADGAVQDQPSVEMRWAPIPAPSSPDALKADAEYQLQYRLTPGAYSEQDLYYDYPGRGTARAVDGIHDGTTLEWRVRATVDIGAVEPATGPWSPWRAVTRDESPVVLLSPAEDATVGTTPTLSWQGPGYSAIGYRVEVSRLDAVALWGDLHWDRAANTGATSFRTGELVPGTYRWRVKRVPGMYFQEDGEGPWAVGTFTVEGDPLLHPVSPGPGDTVRADDAVLAWEPWANVPYYSLMIGTSPDVTWDTAVYIGYSVSTVHPVSEVLPDGDLYWRVCSSINCSEATGFAAGSSEPRVLHVVAAPGPDASPPVAKVASVAPVAGGRLAADGSTPATISWTALDNVAIAGQELQVRRGTGGWVTVPVSAAARSASVWLRGDSSYTIRVRATDPSDNTSGWSTLEVRTRLRQEGGALWRWSSGWTRTLNANASGGATRWAKRTGATASITVTARSIALVAPRSSTRGSAQVWVDGVRVTTIRLDAAPTGSRRIVYVRTWPAAGEHRITIKVSGTSGHPRVDVDALVTFR